MIEMFFGSIFLSNVLLSKYLGIKLEKEKLLSISILTSIINFISSIINYFINILLVRLDAIYFRNITFILTIIIVSSIVLIIYKYIFKVEEDLLKTIITNSIILGTSLIIVNQNYDIVNTAIYSLGISIGYIFIMYLISNLNNEFNKRKVLVSFKGYPILLITLGILCMVLERL